MLHRHIIVIALTSLALAACGGNQQVADDEAPAETATTEDGASDEGGEESAEEGDDVANAIPAPDNVSGVPADAESSDSGLAWMVIEAGDGGESPTVDHDVTVHYTGWTTDGEMFDSSVARGESITFPLSKLIKGWQEGIPMMTRGEKRRFWIPAELAYGSNPREGAPAGMLVFDIELIDFAAAAPKMEPKE